MISITFDDGWETTYTVAAPLLAKNGIRSTQYLATGLFENPAYLSVKQVEALRDQGHQITCHSVSHPDLTKIGEKELKYELLGCQQYLSKKKLGKAEDFAAPYGRTNPSVIAGIEQVFRSARNTNGDLVGDVNESDINLPSNTNPYNIIGVTVHHDTTIKQLKAAVDYAIANNGWLVLTYHQAEENGAKFSLDAKSLREQLEYLSSTPVRIVPVGDVMDSLPEGPKE